jgi:hypothetical protein
MEMVCDKMLNLTEILFVNRTINHELEKKYFLEQIYLDRARIFLRFLCNLRMRFLAHFFLILVCSSLKYIGVIARLFL